MIVLSVCLLSASASAAQAADPGAQAYDETSGLRDLLIASPLYETESSVVSRRGRDDASLRVARRITAQAAPLPFNRADAGLLGVAGLVLAASGVTLAGTGVTLYRRKPKRYDAY